MGILRGGVDAHMLSLSSFSRGHLIEAFTSRSVFYGNLVGGLDHVYFSIQLGMSSSQLTFIFFRGVGIPPTRNDLRTHGTFNPQQCDVAA